jgi:hypothetical protein
MQSVSFSGYVLSSKGEKITSSCPRLTHHKVTDNNSTPSELMIKLVTFLHQLHQTGHVHGDPQLTTGITRLRTIVPPLPPSEILDPILAQLHKLLFELWVQ